jgi:large subunit ribosomal protein L17
LNLRGRNLAKPDPRNNYRTVMRHLKRTAKLGRTGEHRNAMLANLVCSLIRHRRITTTVAKAKAARSVAEKMVTLAKRGTLHDRRLASSRLHQDEEAVRMLFREIAPAFKERNGGYTRIVRLGRRPGDAAEMAILEWVESTTSAQQLVSAEPAAESRPAGAEGAAPEQVQSEHVQSGQGETKPAGA